MKETWFEKMKRLMEQVPDDFKFEKDVIEKGEEIIGVLPENLLKIYRVLTWLLSQLIEKEKAHEKICRQNDETCKSFHQETMLLKEEMEALKNVLFVSVRHEMDLSALDYPAIGIREGKYVVSLSDDLDNIEELFKTVLGPPDIVFGIRRSTSPDHLQ